MNVRELLPAFLAACPGLTVPWKEHLAFWSGSDRGIYSDASIVADYIVDRYEAGDLPEVAVAFAVLERCLAEGDEETREVTTIGIIEGIQTLASHRSFGPEAFEPWLGPRSRVAWLVGVAAWGCQFALADWLRGQLRSKTQPFAEPDQDLVRTAGMQEFVKRLYPK